MLAACVVALVGFGIVMVYSASAVFAAKEFGASTYFLARQSAFAVFGIVAMAAASRIDYHLYLKLTYPMLFVAAGGLVLCATGLGTRVGGASRWLRLGPIGIQPSEIAKLAVIMYLSYSLAKKAEKVKTFTVGFLPHVLCAALFVALLLLQPDFGTAIVIALTTFTLLFVAGARMGYLVGIVLVALPLAYKAVVGSAYRMRRIMAFLNPWEYRYDVGYQISESLMSFGSGGLWGVGLGDGKQKLFFLPEAHNDFISAIIGEELGFVGIAAMLGVYAIIVYRGIRIAWHAADAYGTYVAFGVSTLLGMQVLVNLGVAMGSLPTKGLTLPFVSYGGSSLVLMLYAVGILINISRTRRTAPTYGWSLGSGPNLDDGVTT
ncbi:MAG: putative lipid II flippase FtsW [Deltaproteobacteria bacterium]|nr:putative lipid II flippase FtsW [Deltaproteobacteria bacterium]